MCRTPGLGLLVALLAAGSLAVPQAEAQSAVESPLAVDPVAVDIVVPDPNESPPPITPITPNADRIEEARLLFLAATRAFESGRFEDALVSFERSYELAEDHALLYNIAVTLERLRRDDEAIEAFQTYLRLRPSTPDRAEIEGRIRVIGEQRARQRMLVEAASEQRGAALVIGPTGSMTTNPTTPHDDEGSIFERWWLWAAVVAVVAGAAVAVALVVADDRASPIAGDEGVVLMALDGP